MQSIGRFTTPPQTYASSYSYPDLAGFSFDIESFRCENLSFPFFFSLPFFLLSSSHADMHGRGRKWYVVTVRLERHGGSGNPFRVVRFF